MPQHDGREEVTEDGRPYIPYAVDRELYASADTPREEMVQQLIRSGDLTIRQGQDILNLTEESTPLSKIAGYIAGEFGIPPQTISEAVEGTDAEIDARVVDEQKRNFVRSSGDFGGSITKFLWDSAGTAADVARGAAGIQAPFDVDRSGFSVNEGGLFAEDAWYRDTEEELADKEERARVRDDTRGVIRALESEGYITNSRATKMLSVTDDYEESTAQELYDEITGLLDGYQYTSQGQAVQFSEALRGLERRGALSPGAVAEQEQQAAEEIGDEIAATAAVETQGWGEYTRFDDLLTAAGYGAPQRTIADSMKSETTEFLIDWGKGKEIEYKFDAAIGKNAILDRATGTVLTNEMYNMIRTDDALRKRYQELGKPTETVRGLLDSGKFTNAGGMIPVEDLEIPSIAPSKSWETEAYNWTAGSGVGQWSGMAAYSRQAKVKYMVSSGMATDEQAADYINPFSLSGGQQWERVLGISRELQVDPYQAMNSIGGEIDRIRKLVNRPSGGGGGRSGGGRGPTYSVPASLREIPDYKTLATRAKGIFNQELGRDMEDWELSALADELKDKYIQSNNQRIKINKAAWNDAVAGGSTKVDFSEVEEPLEGFEFDLNEKYASELDRYDRVEDRANNRRLMMDSIAVGERMI